MINNSIASLVGTLVTFAIGFGAFFMGDELKRNPALQIVVISTFVVIVSTLTVGFLFNRIVENTRTGIVDFALWYIVIALPTVVGILAANYHPIGMLLTVVTLLAILLSMVTAYVGFTILSRVNSTSKLLPSEYPL